MKDKLLDKIIKRDYNDELEEVLAKKEFSEDVKNLLLDILYKIEIAYQDYTMVKRNVLPKEEYIQNIINVVKKNCKTIEFIKPNSKNEYGNKTFIVEKKNKKIVCYPMERKLLYSLAKIQKSTDIARTEIQLVNKALTNAINTGNNINTVEPLRDFNGYSWNISVGEIENLYYNLLYQNLIILIGNDFFEEWSNKNNRMVDYVHLLESNLQLKYGKDMADEIMAIIFELTVVLEFAVSQQTINEVLNEKQKVEQEISSMNNKKNYLEEITIRKKSIIKKLKNMDMILNDKELLLEEYEKRNRILPLEKKIFSIKVLTKRIEEEREELLKQLEENNKLMNPKNFKDMYNDLQKKYKYLKLVDVDSYDKKIKQDIINLQKSIIKCLAMKTKNITEKSELTKILYELRYYNLLPIQENKKIGDIKQLEKLLSSVKDRILFKAKELKIINEIFATVGNELKILSNIFSLQIISLEDIYIKISKEKDGYYVYFYDEDVLEEKIKIGFDFQKQDLKIKLNKKIKLFI